MYKLKRQATLDQPWSPPPEGEAEGIPEGIVNALRRRIAHFEKVVRRNELYGEANVESAREALMSYLARVLRRGV